MTIRLYTPDAQTRVEHYQKVASTAFAFNDLVYIDGDGFLALAVDGSLFVPLGLVQKTIASTDSDYADNTRVPVLVCGPEAEYLADVGVGTGAAGDVGEFVDADGAGSAHQNIDLNSSTYDVFEVTGFIS